MIAGTASLAQCSVGVKTSILHTVLVKRGVTLAAFRVQPFFVLTAPHRGRD